MKKIVILIFIFNSINIFSQTSNEVTLVVSAQGQTMEEAKQNALRGAIEQAFGAFVSSKTEILNDELVRDEVVSVSNGNIKEYKILNQVFLEEQKVYLANIQATVSLAKLASFVQSKGFSEIGFDGGGFTMNLKLQRLNETAELEALKNIFIQGLLISKDMFDRELIVGQPKISKEPGKYEVPIEISNKLNKNWEVFNEYFRSSLLSISMSANEVASYTSLNKSSYKFIFLKQYDDKQSSRFKFYEDTSLFFRNRESLAYLNAFFFKMNTEIFNNFEVIHELDTIKVGLDYLAEYKFSNNYRNVNDWFIPYGENVGKLPFNCSSTIEKDVRSNSIAILSQSFDMENVLLNLTSFSLFGGRIHPDRYEWREFEIINKEFLSPNCSESLKNIVAMLLDQNGTLERSFSYSNSDTQKLYFVNNQSFYNSKLSVNLTFTEEQLEKIKGFKLIKK